MLLPYHEVLGDPQSTTPLCLIAGLGNDLQVLKPFAAILRRERPELPVILFDNRGAGRTDAPPPPYSIEEMAGDVVFLLDHLKVPRAHIFGHSMGGFVAQRLAIAQPGRVDRLLLCSTAPRLSRRNILLFAHCLQGILTGPSPEWITKELFFWMLPLGFFDKDNAEERLNQLVKGTMSNPYLQPLDGLKGQISAMDVFDATPGLGAVTAPTLVLQGGADPLILPREARELAQAIPGAGMEILEGIGHLPHYEDAEALKRLVLDFLFSDS